MCFLFLFCIYFSLLDFCLFGCKFEVWRKKTPHSFSSKVFLHYYKFYFFLFSKKKDKKRSKYVALDFSADFFIIIIIFFIFVKRRGEKSEKTNPKKSK
jgi:hypothetical protein